MHYNPLSTFDCIKNPNFLITLLYDIAFSKFKEIVLRGKVVKVGKNRGKNRGKKASPKTRAERAFFKNHYKTMASCTYKGIIALAAENGITVKACTAKRLLASAKARVAWESY